MHSPLPDTHALPPRGTDGERAQGWRVMAPSVLLLLMVAALVVLPFMYARTVQSAHDRMRLLTEPAGAAVTAIHVALALEGSLLGDFVDTRDSTLLRRYREAVEQEEAAARRLAPIVAQLGGGVHTRFAEMERTQDAWHRSVERRLATAGSGGGRTALHGEAYEDVLLATARLDEAIDLETASMRSAILGAERAHRWLSVTLALLGLIGAGVVVWLARRLHVYASALEEREGQLRAAVEGRARLMRGISHDLKNPLHTVDGHAQLLQDEVLGPLAPGQQDSVARIRRGVRSLATLVDDLLELSRAEAGQLSIVRREVDLLALLDEVVAEHEGTARAAGHRVTKRFTVIEGASVVTDAERVRQVLGNLLSNAVKYTPRGGDITVYVERRERAAATRPGGWMAVDVIDTGPGVPAHQTESIFDEFSRLPMHAEQPGVGLGLAIARRVARLLGGDLSVQNVPGISGACFTLWLPAAPSA
jgi:signal transduction histidine kinase